MRNQCLHNKDRIAIPTRPAIWGLHGVARGSVLWSAVWFCVASQKSEATVTSNFGGGVLNVSSDGSDAIALSCSGGLVVLNGTTLAVSCNQVIALIVNGGPGDNSIQLSLVTAPLSPGLIQVNGAGGNDLIVGTDLPSNSDIIDGGPGNDTLLGGLGDDILNGSLDNDTLIGGAGNDQLIGGPGDDVYSYQLTGGGTDTITENPGEGTNDRATFVSMAGGPYIVTAMRCSRGDNILNFNAQLDRLTVTGDSSGEPNDNDTFNVTPSAGTTITLTDTGSSTGDVMNYDSDMMVCALFQGGSVVAPGFKPVFFNGIETRNIVVNFDCNANNVEDACDIDPSDPDGNGSVSPNCNLNMAPDECETNDCNGNDIPDNCETDSDSDTVINDCDNCPTVFNPGQSDGDGDEVGDQCDNCVAYCNPEQIDENDNNIGDACELRISSELLPPDCGGYGQAHYAITANAIQRATCSGGPDNGLPCVTNAECDAPGVCGATPPGSSVNPPHTVFFYQNVHGGQGRLFAKEIAASGQTIPVTVQWRRANGSSVGNPVIYYITDQRPAESESGSLGYDVAAPDLFRNVVLQPPNGEGFTLTLDTPYFPSIQYNSTILDRPANSIFPHIRYTSLAGQGFLVELQPNCPEGVVLVQYTDGSGGVLRGFEAVQIRNVTPPPATPIGVGRQIPIPAGTDCKAAFLRNGTMANPVAWQREERSFDIWPIRPEPVQSNLQIIWFRSTPLFNCWMQAWTRHTTDWPADPQTFVLDSTQAPNPPLVVLPVGESPEGFCKAEIMFQARLTQASPLPLAEIVDVANKKRFKMQNPGWAVVRFDRRIDDFGVTCNSLPGTPANPTRAEVQYEVVRGYAHTNPFVFPGVLQWPIGEQLTDPDHNTDTPEHPYGYRHVGQPFAADIYADTGQIFPVNDSSKHGNLQVWWFKEGTYAPGVYWPHKVVHYNAQWPATNNPNDFNDDPLIIASRLGAGSYPIHPDTQVYHAGVFGANDNGTLLGWNPNDEHTILLPIAGRNRAFAVRDDNPWGVESGHPYALIKYREEPPPAAAGGTPLWRMGVHQVIGEQTPYFFDYTEFPSQADPELSVPVVAGLPLDPLFPVNFGGAAPCEDGDPPAPLTSITSVCVNGANDGELCDAPGDCPNGVCTGDGVWVDRTSVIWAAEGEDDITNQPSAAGILLWENWAPDGGCQPWRDFDTDEGDPTPIAYRPDWPPAPPECNWPEDPICARPVKIGQTVVDQSGQCGAVEVLHDSVGIKIIDSTHEVSTPFPTFPTLGISFELLPPHLFGGTIGGSLPWPDRIRFAGGSLFFRGIMSDRDRAELRLLNQNVGYRGKIDELYHRSRVQITGPACVGGANAGMTCTTNEQCPASACSGAFVALNQKFVSAADPDAKPGWLSLAFQNDDACAPVGSPTVQIWRVDCPPDPGQIRVLVPTCPFNEKQVLQITIDSGGEPENLIFQWQWATNELGPWYDYNPPIGFEDGSALREVIIGGSSPFTLADSWWRVRYRGYTNCPCAGANCDQGADPWPAFLMNDNTKITAWTEPQLAEGWIKRVLRGLNPFDQRIRDFHDNAVATYVNMIQQAGNRFEAPVALNCTPENINGLGLIEAYETVLGRARLFSIEQGISYDPANLALLLVTSQIGDLYMLLGHEAFADATDPTIGFFGGTPPTNPTAAFCFEGQAPNLLEEELALLRGTSEEVDPLEDADGFIIATPYNRLLWNFLPGNNAGRIAYANNYQFTQEGVAINTYPQGHGDSWGHYMTALKKYYTLLKHPVFEWIVSTESVLIGGQEPTEVGYQYERKFARAAAALAKTGVAITDLTFRQMYTADPTQQDGYPDPSTEFPDRRWGVADWARRAGQGAYFNWLTANALLDDNDDDPSHENTIRKIDRSTVLEIGEIAQAFTDIQTTLNNADTGLNPLGLSTSVVPFGLDPNQISNTSTHFDQIFGRAVSTLQNAIAVFNYANDNTRRLRTVQDSSTEFAATTAQRERDFTNRLIEIFGRPYPEDIGPGGAYPVVECPDGQCPDVFHFDYVDPSALAGLPISTETTTFTATFRDRTVDMETGVSFASERIVNFTVAANGFGLIKPANFTERPEPGTVQLARSELLQALGKYQQAIAGYEINNNSIRLKVEQLNDLYAQMDSVMTVRNILFGTETTLRAAMVAAKAMELTFKAAGSTVNEAAKNAATGVPEVQIGGLAVGGSFGSVAKAVIQSIGGASKAAFVATENAAAFTGFTLSQAIETGRSAAALQIEGYNNTYAIQEKVRDLEGLIRNEVTLRINLYTLGEAMKQSIGKYQAAVGKGLRILEEREAFRQKTANTVSQYRYQDMAFRIFRNESLQKYREQFDLAALYVYLAARVYDYETNLLGTDMESGRSFLTNIVKERVLGVMNGTTPQTGAGLADSMARLSQNFNVLRAELGFNSPSQFTRTFSLRWELFRITDVAPMSSTGTDDLEWMNKLQSYVIPNLSDLHAYRVYAQPLQGAPAANPAIVIPFSTTVQAGQNLFGRPSTGDETLPSDRFAIKLKSYSVRFRGYPGAPLNNQVNVYLIPAGADILRVPTCPDSPIREWHLLDQTLPVPFPLGQSTIEQPAWMPWDTLQGGASSLVRRRLIPTVGACDLNAANCDSSIKLTGRSVWNTEWLLVIPESELAGDPNVNGIDVLINGSSPNGGISDIKLQLVSYGYSGCGANAAGEEVLLEEPATIVEPHIDDSFDP